MQEGWKAKGLLKPLWLAHGGRKKVAGDAGISEGHLSKVNAGKAKLGLTVATKVASVTGVSVLELGAPVEQADAAGETLLSRLEELAAAHAESARKQTTMAREIARLQERVRRLEARPWPREAQSTDL